MTSSHHQRNVASLALGAATALLFVTACSSGDDASTPASSPPAATSAPTNTGEVRLTVKDFAFSPATLTVRPGEKIEVVNQDSEAHTVTSTEGKTFDTGSIPGGGSATLTSPSDTGRYSFDCTFHPSMKGTLIVR